jgi:Uma2 family endonuclease
MATPGPGCDDTHQDIARAGRRINAHCRSLNPQIRQVHDCRQIGVDYGMVALPQTRMTVDDFLAWAESQPGRYELNDGVVHAMSPENAGHAEAKAAVHAALRAAIRERRLPCHALPDGMTVRTDHGTAYEPDALVYCGTELAPTAIEVPRPIIVVEVLPSTRHIDLSRKLAGYFRLPSVAHYLIVDPVESLILHHARGTGDTIITRIVTTGSISLDPPGLELALADIYGSE